jgi:hypothetical protein
VEFNILNFSICTNELPKIFINLGLNPDSHSIHFLFLYYKLTLKLHNNEKFGKCMCPMLNDFYFDAHVQKIIHPHFYDHDRPHVHNDVQLFSVIHGMRTLQT